MNKVFLYVLIGAAMVGLTACAQPVSGEVIKSDKERAKKFKT